ncbi:MAG: AMP-binding protein, partial [Streptosporangiaceae bacterium]
MTQGTGHAAGESLTALLAGGDADHPALIVPDSGEVLTYGQAADRVEALARRLAGLGARRGDRIALALPNGPDVVLLLLAVTALGAAAAPLNPAYTAAEYEFFLADIAPRLMLIPASGAAAAAAAAAATGTTLIGVRPAGG